MVSSVSNSGASLGSAAGIERLIQQSLQYERMPLDRLQAQKDDLKVKNAIYNDIKTKMETLRNAVEDLNGESGSLNKYVAKFSEEDVLSISASTSNPNVQETEYNINVTQLAQNHVVTSSQHASTTTALGFSGDLTLNGQKISVAVGHSLTNIRDAINEIDFAGNGVEEIEATIVDNKLVLTSKNSGEDAVMTISQANGNIGKDLGLIKPDDSLNVAQEAKNALLTVNGVTIERQKNNALDDIIDGLTFNLEQAGSTKAKIQKDSTDVVKQVNTLLDAYNDLVKHLKLKTEPQLDEAATGNNPTYTAAPLGRDLNMKSLRFNLSSDLLSAYSSAASGAPRILSDLGITIGDDGISFELSEQEDLTDAIDENFEDVSAMLSHILDKVETRMASYLDDDDAIIETTQDSNEERMDVLDDQIDSYESRLTRREETLRKQYYALQAQIINMNYQFQSTQATMYGSVSLLNQQG